MKKISFRLYAIISLSIVAVLFLLGFIADQIVKKGIFLYTGLSFFTIDDIRVLAVFVAIFLLTSVILISLFRYINNKSLNIVLAVILVLISLLVLIYLLVGIGAWSPRAYVELVSDDGEHQIVIAEDCYFFSPYGGDIYEKTSPFTMKKLAKYTADIDFYTPFSDGKYTVTWNAENFELVYDFNGDGEIDESILIDYLDE